MAVGRISGPLLKANLLRQGVDLAFETDLVYLKVTDLDSANHRVGIKTNDPTHTLTVNGTTKTTNLLVDTLAEIADISISGTTVSTSQDVLSLLPSGTSPVVYQAKLRVDDIELENNVIRTHTTNTDLELRPNGTGTVEVFANTNVYGNIHATGNISADGNITLGDSDTDNITFAADVASNIIPDLDDTYTLGESGKRWADVWTNNLFADVIDTGDLIVDNINLNLRQGNIIYVASNGSDSYSGTHQNDPYLTVRYALSQATAGDTVYVYPGDYEEIFPLTIPQGVSIVGANLRSVIIRPTAATRTQDCFKMNGETTVQDFTITGFEYDSVGNTGHAFTFVPGFTVTSRSPYVKNITVLTFGSSVRLGTNAADDPRGYAAGDAGHGAFLDGSLANASSKEAAMLFHAVTFITPGAETLTATNGARIEWLNSFTYFADKGMYLYSGTTGFAGQGRTAVRVTGNTGTFAVGNTLSYYDTDGTTVLGSGTIADIDPDGKIYLTGKITGLETQSDRGGKTITANGNAKLSTAEKKFGTASLALDGTGDYASVATNSDFGYGTEDFTIEMWVYRTVSGITQVLLDQRTANPTNYAPVIFINTSNALQYNDGAASVITGATTVPLNAWSHVALSRNGTSTRLFLNGVQQGSTYTDTRNYIATPLTIGARFNNIQNFTGYIDDLRISKGVARYTSNFTAPTAALTNDQYSVLLAHFDGADTSTVFLDDVLLPQDIRTSAGGTATAITLLDHSDFGVEVRSIGSASVYGNYGIYGDGLGVIAYLIGQNLAYIGTQYRSDNDPTYVVQANEVVELNGAKLYYSSVDHKGDFRVGDLFYVNQDAGTVEFTTTSFNISSLTGVTFTDGTSTTYIDGTEVSTGNIKISGNTIESTSGVVNILSASDEINLQNNVNIAGNLDVTGNVTVGGNITLGNQPTDTINIVAGITSNITPGVTETYTLGTNGLQWANLFTGNLHVDSINIDGNVIKTVDSNADLELRANGTGRIYVPNDNVLIDNDLTVLGTTTLGNTDITGTVTYTGDVIQTGDVVQTGNYSVSGTLTVGSDAQFQNIKIAGNTIRTTLSNSNLELSAAGTGIITMPYNDVSLGQNLTVGGNVSSTNALASNRITAEEFFTGDILVKDNYIATTVSNSNLELRANGTGYIVLEEFNVNANVISSNSSSDIILTPGAGKVVSISSNQSLIIPVGNTADRPTAESGMIRFNSQMGRYEGYDGVNWIKLSGVGDLDETTYITAELTPGANDDTIRFYNNNALTADLTSARLQAPRIEVDNLIIDGNTISSTTNTDIIFNATGAGSIRLANFAIKDNTITNTVSNAITTITQSGTGYFKIAGTNGFVVPTGISSERPTAYAVTGMTRYNSELKQLEIYNGVSWDSAAGAGGGINAATAEDIAITYALILG
jgi:hypothetical protein